MLSTIVCLFVLAMLAPAIVSLFKANVSSWILAGIVLALFIYFFQLIPFIRSNQSILNTSPWFPQLGINLSFYLDGLSLLFALLITGIGVLVIIYSGPYLGRHPELGRYYGFLLFFMASMLGLVLANNLLLIFLFWELTSLSSFLLIGFEHQNVRARKAAIQALFVTSLGGLALFAGIILIGTRTHSFDLHGLMLNINVLRNDSFYIPILILILLGAFTKSAQFPFHFWLPAAMEAPTPISAYLHSATMVKAGVYLLARMHPLMAHTGSWFIVLTATGGITMLLGAVQALKQTDIKAILAYTTIIALGSLVFLLGSDQKTIAQAVIAFILAHAMYKASLFMAAGDIQHRVGTRDIYRLHGLIKFMPVTFGIVLVTGASMAGLPPLLGYYVKELVYEANLAAPAAAYILTAIVVFSNMVYAAISLQLVIRPFFGKEQTVIIKEAEPQMWFGGILLALITIVFSSTPGIVNKFLIAPAAHAVFPTIFVNPTTLSLWHGFTPSFALSIITILGAIILFQKMKAVRKWLTYLRLISNFSPSYLYRKFMQGIAWYTDWQTHWLQCGILRIYLNIIFFTISAVVFTAFFYLQLPDISYFPNFSWLSSFIALLLILSTFSTALVRSYLVGLVYIGLFGIIMALLFLFDGAPDVAMTQVMVETLIVIIIVLNLYHQPALPLINADSLSRFLTKTLFAVSFGLIITLLLINISWLSFNPMAADFYINNSVSLAHGRNIVNVILIDFRAMDTLGEITVISIAAFGIISLLQGRYWEE